MGWIVVQRRLGRAGGVKARTARQRDWDRKYGEGMWQIGYVIEGEFINQDDAFESVYCQSYREYFEQHPKDLEELRSLAKALRNPHALATTGVDLQVPAIEQCLQELGLELHGKDVVDVGTWKGERSHPISERLSPLAIPCCLEPRKSLESFWQSKKCLAVWEP